MAAVAAVSTAFTTLHVPKPAIITLTRANHRHLRTLICSSLSSTPTTEFNITFAPPKPKPEPEPIRTATTDSNYDAESELGEQLYIPWIVRDEKGNLTLQSSPPASLLHAMANANTSKKKKKEKVAKAKPVASSTEPKLSKAARRYYNENFRDPPQRLSKVLAAAGGKRDIKCFLMVLLIINYHATTC